MNTRKNLGGASKFEVNRVPVQQVGVLHLQFHLLSYMDSLRRARNKYKYCGYNIKKALIFVNCNLRHNSCPNILLARSIIARKTTFHMISLQEWHTRLNKIGTNKATGRLGKESHCLQHENTIWRYPRLYIVLNPPPPFYCYIFMGQTGITGRHPILAHTPSFTFVPSIFCLFPL